MERRTGRTFRMVLLALINASEGKKVAYVSNTRDHLEVAMRMAAKAITDIAGVRLFKDRVEFPGNGYVKFIPQQNYQDNEKMFHGRSSDPVVIHDLEPIRQFPHKHYYLGKCSRCFLNDRINEETNRCGECDKEIRLGQPNLHGEGYPGDAEWDAAPPKSYINNKQVNR